MDRSHQLFSNIRPYLENYIEGDYTLSPAGAALVFESNKQSYETESGTEAVDFGISDYWYEYFAEKLAVLPPRAFGSAVDVCCGAGLASLNVMKRRMFDSCYAIDISETNIERLNRRAREAGIEGLTALCRNIVDTRFEDSQFDCVFGNSFLHHLPDNPSFIREAFRILKPGGVLCLTGEPSVSATRLEGWVIDRLRPVARALGRQARSSPTPVLRDIWQYRADDTERMLKDAGFSEVRIAAWGRLGTVLGAFVEGAYFEIVKRQAPVGIFRVRQLGNRLDRLFSARKGPDSFAHFLIAARKPDAR